MRDELDILREVGSIAAGHGSVALSEMLKGRINLRFPSVVTLTASEIPSKLEIEKIAIIVYSKILVGLEGEVAVLLNRDNAHKLINLSYKVSQEERGQAAVIAEMGLSVIKEIGNVIICAYLNALSLILKRLIIPPIPTLISGSVEDVLSMIITSHSTEGCCSLVETTFEEPETSMVGSFYLIVGSRAVEDIRKTCRNIL